MSTQTEQKVAEPIEKKQEEVKQTDAQITTPPQETQEQINWKKFREAREIERKQKEAAEKLAEQEAAKAKAFKDALDALVNKPSMPYVAPSEVEVSDEDRLKKLIDEEMRKRDEERKRIEREREAQELPQKLNMVYPDFTQVVSTENLDYLEYHHPEIARMLKRQEDNFEKWADVYKAVKRYVPNTESKKEVARAEKNATKPQSMSVAGATPTGDHAPIDLSESRRKENWARMQRVMKGIK